MSTLSMPATNVPSPTRRSVLAAGATALATIAAGAAGPTDALAAGAAVPTAAAALSEVDRRAITLWARRRRLIRFNIDAVARELEAENQLPWWMKPGPRHLYADGSFGEEQSGWPAIPDAKPPHAGRINIRPDEDFLWGLYQANRNLGGETAQAAYDKARADLRARVEARDREYDRLGVMESAKRSERTCNAIIDVEEKISDLDCEASPYAAAAMALLTAREVARDDGAEIVPNPGAWLFITMLRLLRPAIDGLIAEDVDRALAAADTYDGYVLLAAIDPRFPSDA